MGSPDPNLLVIYGYKTLVILVGFACICLGIWLAFRRVDTRVGDLDAKAGEFVGIKIVRPTASALLFLVGAAIVIYGVTRPFSYENGRGSGTTDPAATAEAAAEPGGTRIQAERELPAGGEAGEQPSAGVEAPTDPAVTPPAAREVPPPAQPPTGGIKITDTVPVSGAASRSTVRISDTAAARPTHLQFRP